MRWVMSLGSHAWVVEPEDLRARIELELEASLERYASVEGVRRPAQLGLFE
jgi:predicted DNA-binding transcriptional regulator YafY